jgi:hypothetical protein
MRVLGYTWAGVRSTDLKSTVSFFCDTLGLSLIEQHESFAQFEMPSGQLFEVFGSKSRYYQLHACPVLGFQVEDVRAARKELESAGVVRYRCLWRRIRSLDVFSRPGQLCLRALANTMPHQKAAASCPERRRSVDVPYARCHNFQQVTVRIAEV